MLRWRCTPAPSTTGSGVTTCATRREELVMIRTSFAMSSYGQDDRCRGNVLLQERDGFARGPDRHVRSRGMVIPPVHKARHFSESVNPLIPSRSNRIMMVASTRGSSATPYSVLPERMSVSHASCELRRVTRFLRMTTVPDQVDVFARLFVPFDGLQVAVNVPSSLI